MTLQKKISNEQLVAFSEEHLYYELNMFFGLNKLLSKGVNDQYIYSALLESFIIHACLILDFFYKPPQKYDDASVLHYVRDIKEWKKLRPSYDKYFRKFHRRRSREVVHLSYKRLEVDKGEKMWNIQKIVPEIYKLVDAFFQAADPQLLHTKMKKMRGSISEEIGAHDQFSR